MVGRSGRTGVEPGLVSVYVTIGDEEQAAALSKKLLDARLIACANIWPVRSVYRWEGKVEDTREAAMLLKTRKDRVPALLETLPILHPYELPCVEVYATDTAHGPYADWVWSETAD